MLKERSSCPSLGEPQSFALEDIEKLAEVLGPVAEPIPVGAPGYCGDVLDGLDEGLERGLRAPVGRVLGNARVKERSDNKTVTGSFLTFMLRITNGQ